MTTVVEWTVSVALSSLQYVGLVAIHTCYEVSVGVGRRRPAHDDLMYDVAHGGAGGTRRADRFSQKEQNSSVRQHPVRCKRLGTALESQTDSVKKNRIRLSSTRPLSDVVSCLCYRLFEN